MVPADVVELLHCFRVLTVQLAQDCGSHVEQRIHAGGECGQCSVPAAADLMAEPVGAGQVPRVDVHLDYWEDDVPHDLIGALEP